MKTYLPTSITTIEQAQAFLRELHLNREHYHPEDDAHDIEGWPNLVSNGDCEQLNKLMSDIYMLPGNDGRHFGEMVFDPCQYLNYLDKADMMITIDGMEMSLRQYVDPNDWTEVSGNLDAIINLEEDEDFYQPVHCGFVTIKRVLAK